MESKTSNLLAPLVISEKELSQISDSERSLLAEQLKNSSVQALEELISMLSLAELRKLRDACGNVLLKRASQNVIDKRKGRSAKK